MFCFCLCYKYFIFDYSWTLRVEQKLSQDDMQIKIEAKEMLKKGLIDKFWIDVIKGNVRIKAFGRIYNIDDWDELKVAKKAIQDEHDKIQSSKDCDEGI